MSLNICLDGLANLYCGFEYHTHIFKVINTRTKSVSLPTFPVSRFWNTCILENGEKKRLTPVGADIRTVFPHGRGNGHGYSHPSGGTPSASVLYTRKFSRFTDGRSLVLPRLSPTPA